MSLRQLHTLSSTNVMSRDTVGKMSRDMLTGTRLTRASTAQCSPFS